MNNYFFFDGRIRRTHYALRCLLISGLSTFIVLCFIFIDSDFLRVALFLPFSLLTWFGLATATKRCHDLGKSGWWQLIPFYGIVMLFAEGTKGDNKYGPDPKQPGSAGPQLQPQPQYKQTQPVTPASSSTKYQPGTYNGADNGQYAAAANYNVNASSAGGSSTGASTGGSSAGGSSAGGSSTGGSSAGSSSTNSSSAQPPQQPGQPGQNGQAGQDGQNGYKKGSLYN
ncbi:MAG TPA: DUF805 domain-containing protein [Puia sp.]|jgi:uncharacterized membrane protein YhaH (DUF805 family)|nr:DUF805 domain-containing protein [Puia sp.]